MSTLYILLLCVYGLCLAFLFCYSMVQLHLTILYWRSKRHIDYKPVPQAPAVWPKVTVQLPLFNERYVVERLLKAITALDYPREKLQIQILDDSTDDTSAIIRQKLQELSAEGFAIDHLQRPERTGYKAGALQYGLAKATGAYIAIFDADFVPAPDFLKRTIPAFTDASTGVVQTHWAHLNKTYSLLTRLQAFGLDAHFTVEQVGRSKGGHFINFNGTAGVWRKQCILDAGGWQADTLTEDLDLSYRAQLLGWQFVYLEAVEAPAELPAAMGALKSQQYRWTKGAAETARKHLATVLQSDKPLLTKLHATFHLLNSSVFICILLSAILSLPILFLKQAYAGSDPFFSVGSFLVLSLLGLIAFYWTALYQQHRSFWKTTAYFIPTFLLFLTVSMGLALHNSLAVIAGYTGKKTPFVRTPKHNLITAADSWRKGSYFMESLNLLTLLEGLLMLYFVAGIAAGVWFQDFVLFPFHFMLASGYGIVFFYSVIHSREG